MNHRKFKKGMNIYSDLSYHLFLYFEWRFNHGICVRLVVGVK